MSQHVHVILIDDLDGTADRVTRHRLGLDGADCEIDLRIAHLSELQSALQPYLASARRLPTRHPSRDRDLKGRHYSTDTTIRAWWADQLPATDLPPHKRHGPIPQQVRDAYAAAQANTAS